MFNHLETADLNALLDRTQGGGDRLQLFAGVLIEFFKLEIGRELARREKYHHKSDPGGAPAVATGVSGGIAPSGPDTGAAGEAAGVAQ